VILEKTISGRNNPTAISSSLNAATGTHERISTMANNTNGNDNDNDTRAATATIATTGNTAGGDTTLYGSDSTNESGPQQEWNSVPDFMDLWNWDAFFEPPLATMQTAPLMGENIH